MFVNIIKSYRGVVAVCDKELLGKRFEQEVEDVIRQLDVKESFYKGEKGKQVSGPEVIEIMRSLAAEDATFNIVGERSVACALKAGIVTEDSIGKIQGVPFALVLL